MFVYTIKNDQLQVKIRTHGAELQSIKKVDLDHEFLWQGDPAYWNRKAPILFPIVGLLKEDTYYIEDKAYHMTKHGFARDSDFRVIDQEDHTITLELEDTQASQTVYPYAFSLQVTYTLEDNALVTSYRVVNRGLDDMPFSIGGHPAFALAGSSHFVFEAERIHTDLIEAGGINTQGKVIDLDHGTLAICEHLFDHDALVLRNMDRVVLKTGDRTITMDCPGFPYLGLWSKPGKTPFVCLEPWYGLGDLVDHNQNFLEKEGVRLLEPGQDFLATYKITLD